MMDYYKHLGADPEAPDPVLRDALASCEGKWRADAEFVLLDPKRRAVYDRNRRLLITIGQLRQHLGLSYTRFWGRQEFKDFWQMIVPAASRAAGKRRVDAMLIARAFRPAGRQARLHATRVSPWWMGFVLLIAVLGAIFLWHWAL